MVDCLWSSEAIATSEPGGFGRVGGSNVTRVTSEASG